MAKDAPKSEKRRTTARVTIRLTPEERTALERRADRAELSLSGYIAQEVLGRPPPRQTRRPAVARQELSRLLGELGKIGSNINQIAKALNVEAAGGRPADRLDVARDVAACREALLEMRDEVLDALGVTWDAEEDHDGGSNRPPSPPGPGG